MFIGSPGYSAPAGLRFNGVTRGRIPNSVPYGVTYPSPFFDIAHSYLPPTMKLMLRWCRHFFLIHPLINSVIFKLAEYPVTEIIIEHEDPEVARLWKEFFEDQLNWRSKQIDIGLDYYTYGTAPTTLGLPFIKYVRCRACKFEEQARLIRNRWIYTNNSFRLTCPRCPHIGEADSYDFYVKNASGIRVLRLNPEDMDIKHNDISGETTSYYTLPAPLRNDIATGKKDIVETTPQIFLQAVREQKSVILNPNALFTMKRPSLATLDRGWGTPLPLPVLKDTFYLTVMRKAQEAVLMEHVVPLRLLFPQPAAGSADPFTSISLQDWKEHIAMELARWRQDPNYIPILPLPVGQQSIGGDGKALLLVQEMIIWGEQIIQGMGVPLEIVKGGASWSGSQVSLRIVENSMLGYMMSHRRLARFVMQNVSSYLGWPMADVKFRPFKMADDLQRKMFLFQMNQAKLISDKSLLAEDDRDVEIENKLMIEETKGRLEATKVQQLAMAKIQGEVQVEMSKYQVKAQQVMAEAQQAPTAPGEPGGPHDLAGASLDIPQAMQSPLSQSQRLGSGESQEMGVDLRQYAQAQAQLIASMPQQQQEVALQNLQAMSPELAALVSDLLSQMNVGQEQQGAAGVDARPLPEQRPPRRDGASI